MSVSAGYSRTPLAKKLGIKQGNIVLVMNSPKPYLEFFHEFPSEVVLLTKQNTYTTVDFIHIFVTSQKQLEQLFAKAKPMLKKNGMLWISWPKKTASIKSALNKFDVMRYGLANGLVDVKVAAIDTDWSGHKFVYRKEDR